MKNFFIVLILVVVGAVGYYAINDILTRGELTPVTIGAHTYYVEVADTPEERARGLQDRISIGRADGMLFVFEVPGRYAFWMERVRFPLDFIWIRDGVVVGVLEDVPPSLEAPHKLYEPPTLITHVLELPAGTVLRNRITVGEDVDIRL